MYNVQHFFVSYQKYQKNIKINSILIFIITHKSIKEHEKINIKRDIATLQICWQFAEDNVSKGLTHQIIVTIKLAKMSH